MPLPPCVGQDTPDFSGVLWCDNREYEDFVISVVVSPSDAVS